MGIEPDITTQPGSWTRPDQDGDDFTPLTESSLRGALSNTDEEEADATSEGTEEDGEQEDNLVYDDYQLYEALNLLKGLNILSQK